METSLVVGIGASAGGVMALRELFAHLPADGGIAYVAMLHLSPDHESHLAEVLQTACAVPVRPVTERTRIEPDHVYVNSPNHRLIVADGYLEVAPFTRAEDRHAPIDGFFATLAESRGAGAACVVLTGTGGDGTTGLKRVKAHGGFCVVQDPDEAEYPDMPRHALSTGVVDAVLPVGRIAGRLLTYRHALAAVAGGGTHSPGADAERRATREVLAELRTRTGRDFSTYKRATVRRRVARRLAVLQIADIVSYAQFLRDNAGEADALARDLLSSVSNFFRDGEPFSVVEAVVIPAILAGSRAEKHVRVWVPACATGEEAYSIAMLLLEGLPDADRPPVVQIFATDINDEAIAVARDGVYGAADVADVPADRLQRFFQREGDRFAVGTELRELVLFASHDVIHDPPFSHLDLVSCRNLLTYLNAAAQRRVLESLHFALRPGGFLLLGEADRVEGAPLFAPIAEGAGVYQRKDVRRPTESTWLASAGPYRRSAPMPASFPYGGPRTSSLGELHRRLLEQYAPPSVVVNDVHEILHLSDTAGRYMQFSGGEPTTNLFKAIRPELRLAVRAALQEAADQRHPVVVPKIPIRLDHADTVLTVHVKPAPQAETGAERLFLVLFEEGGDADHASEPATLSHDSALRHLEAELLDVRSELRVTVEQNEIRSEELKASNEELQAMNEELRSTAEELETSQEELQSINEELSAVNQELKNKIEEQAQARNDIENLIHTTGMAAIFLDRELRVKLFTPRARDLFNLITTDRGRALADITSRIAYENMQADIDHVLTTLERFEREVQTRDGSCLLVQVTPYRTTDDRIDGVVLTFNDITDRKRAEALVRESETRFRAILSQTTAGIAYADLSGRLLFANQRIADMLGCASATLQEKTIQELTHSDDGPGTEARFKRLVTDGVPFEIERRLVLPDGSVRWGNISLSPIRGADGGIESVVAVVIDVSERKRFEEELREREEHLRLVLESITEHAIITLDAHGVISDWNVGAERMFGHTRKEAVGQPGAIIFTPEDRARGADVEEMRAARRDGQASDERWHQRKDGSRLFVNGVLSPLGGGPFSGYVKVARDLTERKQQEEALQQAHVLLESRVAERTAALAAELRDRALAEDEVRKLLSRIINVQEDERRRIARDLHDDLGQKMTALHLKLDALRRATAGVKGAAEQAAEAQAFVQRLDRDLDFFTWELRPAALYDLGLVQALRDFVQQWARNYRIAAAFEAIGFHQERFRSDIEINLYRIAQEALNNVYKHAQAAHVEVVLQRRDAQIILSIEDDGVGIDFAAPTAPTGRGLGLIGMRERATLIGGAIEIERADSGGTTVIVSAPAATPDVVESHE